jgi:CheY-like chemotaxis protein
LTFVERPFQAVIFITASDDEETFRQAIEAGCVAYLHKPFAANLLIGAIKEAIGLDVTTPTAKSSARTASVTTASRGFGTIQPR